MKPGMVILISGCNADGYKAIAGGVSEIEITNEGNRYKSQEYKIIASNVRKKKLTIAEYRKIMDIVYPIC